MEYDETEAGPGEEAMGEQAQPLSMVEIGRPILAAMPKHPAATIPNDDDTAQVILQQIMAECGNIIRDQLRPAIEAADDRYGVSSLLGDVVSAAKTAAHLADAVGRLRGNLPAPEMRQRIVVERVEQAREEKQQAMLRLRDAQQLESVTKTLAGMVTAAARAQAQDAPG
ncbi:MAG: hypothetical protein JO256_00580 [Alphaproteobacteria bacterium]|nr:hypothetical protein [Alphaproteobacteria bacterium]